MSYVLPRLESKKDVDRAIKRTEDKVLVLRFGREADGVCMQLDELVGATPRALLCSCMPCAEVQGTSIRTQSVAAAAVVVVVVIHVSLHVACIVKQAVPLNITFERT